MVPGFTGSIEIDLPVPFTYDLEIGTTRYFTGLEDGEIPLLLLFSGTVFATGRRQALGPAGAVEQGGALPPAAERLAEAIDVHFPDSAWIKMSRETLDELLRFKSREALPTWDATLVRAAATRLSSGGEGSMTLDPAAPRPGPQGRRRGPVRGLPALPVHQSSQKNQARFQFGVLMPPGLPDGRPVRAVGQPDRVPGRVRRRRAGAWSGSGSCSCSAARVLQVQPGTGETREVATLTVDGTEYTAWDEAVEREQQVCAEVGELLSGDIGLAVHVDRPASPCRTGRRRRPAGVAAAGQVLVRHRRRDQAAAPNGPRDPTAR